MLLTEPEASTDLLEHPISMAIRMSTVVIVIFVFILLFVLFLDECFDVMLGF